MVNTEEENKKHTSTIKDEPEKFLDQQKQQISNATDKFNQNINEYQKTSNEIIEKSIESYSQVSTTNH